ncbi:MULTISPECIES: purine-nucleoside phosphorylase [Oceanobacillus]|uniref:Purine nucleoside phosphorylase n=1 Tax=Oceanobacillus kimchii TaxID=746691 RepID=A0ABQ5TPC1_9BACI|nr:MULTISPECIES: purine-nucleoside phosphorylase [Oceanobacillus]MBT2600394.1 purine-nucleoside phosphorylase [Oceanobacillus sp. ISL-74]MBT2650552.1 purine-nucleoside phosphorylase [Oceanobacillus sp. ISL-73]OEH54905.1 purine-nucleoside phosphorylase [Oceanobacillus sp. E9]GLO67444.1 purine nucleoside phosphorylase [Oceanobacillus kimchii]
MHKTEEILEAKSFISEQTGIKPEIGMILGSGLGSLAEEIEDAVVIPYETIPYFSKSNAVGHANELVIGHLQGKKVVAMKGRYHYYEGYTLDEVTFPVRVLKALGVEKLIITNSCGAVNTDFNPGELMLISDHINLVGTNPLIGKNNEDLGTRFPDVSEVYSRNLRALARDAAQDLNITLQEGVYGWWSGPVYETPAEIRMIRILGGDAIGMSTVPEALIAIHSGLEVLGISCLTNMACGILDQPLSHEEVIEVAGQSRDKFVQLIQQTLKLL